ncbi:MAG: hypothetical protein KZQ60_01245 [Candidatus Thiodiazotropha sp. (ex Lucinoma aequizonata)]|nr:hypothetical protein [Candidatus Thiodiazotropha sp. (ex Lucinoma aequizonata)]
MRNKLNELGYQLRKVTKCQPLKKIQETDAIFKEVHQVNSEADQDDAILRISLDTKATVKVRPFSRSGYSRQLERACDHDFSPEATLTPFGILLPKTGDNHLWFSQSKVTADFMVDRLEEMMSQWKKRFALHTLVINADNGPESSGRRTQWLKRLTELFRYTSTHHSTGLLPALSQQVQSGGTFMGYTGESLAGGDPRFHR